jgi:hypothetical protein
MNELDARKLKKNRFCTAQYNGLLDTFLYRYQLRNSRFFMIVFDWSSRLIWLINFKAFKVEPVTALGVSVDDGITINILNAKVL